MDKLSRDLVCNILIRLPATTLGNAARHVCRSWHSIISDPDFVDRHYTSSVSQEDAKTLLFHQNILKYNGGHFMFTKVLEKPEPIRPKHQFPVDMSERNTKNTLVCSGLLLYIYTKDEMVLNFYLCNPILNQSITLPPMRTTLKETRYLTSGFGYDSITKDYKVVLVYDDFREEVGPKSYFYCYSINPVGTEKKKMTKYYNCWREVGHIDNDISGRYDGLFVDGKLHWLLFPKIFETKILSFDLNTESLKVTTFCTIDVPRSKGYKLLGEWNGGKLCVYVGSYEGQKGCTVWVKKEDHESDIIDNWVRIDGGNDMRSIYEYRGYWKKNLFVYNRRPFNYDIVNEKNIVVDAVYDGVFLSSFVPTLVSLSGTKSVTQQDQEDGARKI